MNGEIWTNLLTSGITLIAAIAFGFIVEAIIEYFFAPIFDFEKLKRWEGKPIVMKWIPLAPAILLTIYYKIDIVSYFLNVLARLFEIDTDLLPATTLGFVVSGILIARFSNFCHQWVKSKLPPDFNPWGVEKGG